MSLGQDPPNRLAGSRAGISLCDRFFCTSLKGPSTIAFVVAPNGTQLSAKSSALASWVRPQLDAFKLNVGDIVNLSI